jgi:hypothetical protein
MVVESGEDGPIKDRSHLPTIPSQRYGMVPYHTIPYHHHTTCCYVSSITVIHSRYETHKHTQPKRLVDP